MQRKRGVRNASLELIEAARAMRKAMTPAEAYLWKALRHKHLGVKFRRQHPVGRTILDFYAPACKLVVQVDGPIHRWQRAEDEMHTRHLADYGLTVIRFSNEEVLENLPDVLDAICETVAQLAPTPATITSNPSSSIAAALAYIP